MVLMSPFHCGDNILFLQEDSGLLFSGLDGAHGLEKFWNRIIIRQHSGTVNCTTLLNF